MDDLISRRDAIDAECERCRIAPKKERGHNCTYYVHGCKDIECLRALPSAQPERKKGKWIYKNFVWFCSECGNSPTKGMGYVQGHDELYDFCPHCGADMRERKEE